MFSTLTLEASIPAVFANAGQSRSAPSFAGPPMVLPSRSLGLTMPLDFFTAITYGGLLYIM